MGGTRFSEKVGFGHRNAETGGRVDPAQAEAFTPAVELDEDLQIVDGSANLYRDLGEPWADLKYAKTELAIEIVKILDAENLSTRQAEARTGVSHSEFSRIRRPSLRRFTIDRLMIILDKLGYDVDVSVEVRKRPG
jgi:predicted XRE-type DNA-binding protein